MFVSKSVVARHGEWRTMSGRGCALGCISASPSEPRRDGTGLGHQYRASRRNLWEMEGQHGLSEDPRLHSFSRPRLSSAGERSKLRL